MSELLLIEKHNICFSKYPCILFIAMKQVQYFTTIWVISIVIPNSLVWINMCYSNFPTHMWCVHHCKIRPWEWSYDAVLLFSVFSLCKKNKHILRFISLHLFDCFEEQPKNACCENLEQFFTCSGGLCDPIHCAQLC